MLDVGVAEFVVLVLPAWALVLGVLYWVIRLAVRHGIQDTQRQAEVGRPRSEVSETIRRQRATYDAE